MMCVSKLCLSSITNIIKKMATRNNYFIIRWSTVISIIKRVIKIISLNVV